MAATEVIRICFSVQAVHPLRTLALNPSFRFEHSPPSSSHSLFDDPSFYFFAGICVVPAFSQSFCSPTTRDGGKEDSNAKGSSL